MRKRIPKMYINVIQNMYKSQRFSIKNICGEIDDVRMHTKVLL